MSSKTTACIFQATNKRNPTRENMDMAKEGKPKERKGISSHSSQQHHKDSVKVRIKIQKNRCWLRGDREETNNHIKSESRNFVQKECKTRYDGWTRWSTANYTKSFNLTIRTNGIFITEKSVLENERHKLFGIFRYKRIIWSRSEDQTI